MPAQVGEKSFMVTWLLSLFLGLIGADRFYVGKVGTGILKLITLGGFGLWYIIDLIIILTGSMRDKDGDKLNGYNKNKTVALIATVVFIAVVGVGGAGATNNSSGNEQSSSESSSATASGNKKEQKAPVKPKKWTQIAQLTGNADKSSETIKLSGGQVRLKYNFTGSDPIVGAIYVLEEGTDLMKDGGIPDVTISKAGSDKTILRKDKGDYYLHVTDANAQYTVTLEELK